MGLRFDLAADLGVSRPEVETIVADPLVSAEEDKMFKVGVVSEFVQCVPLHKGLCIRERERKRQTDRQIDRPTDREREREIESACVTTVYRPFVHVRYVCVRERVD